MQVSCNTFETFVVTLSRNCRGFGELNCRHSKKQSIPGQVHNPCNSNAMFCGEFSTHLRTVTPNSFLLHCGIQWRGDTSTVLHSQLTQQGTHISSIWPCAQAVLGPFQGSAKIDSSLVIFSHPQCLQFILFSTIVSSATSDRRVNLSTANHPLARREECPEFHVETPLCGVTDSSESLCSRPNLPTLSH